jgi:peptide/nickel transport system substrate-binding protein
MYPKLATSWETAKDLSSITFYLRQGVKFHDGTPFNAEAAKWNLDIYLERGTGAAASWSSVEALDEYTIRINLKPGAYTNTQLTTGYGMISPTAVQKNGIDWANVNPVGTGPFKFKSFVRDTSLEYERFDDYWGDKARVDGIKYIFIVDVTTAAMAFKAGDAQVWESADAKTSYDLVTKSGYKRETRRGPIMHLMPDTLHEESPFSQLKVRQAVTQAINRQQIVDTMGFGTWEAVDQPNVPEQFGHVPGDFFPYDPDKARQLLAEAGYPDGFSITIVTASIFPQDPLVAIQSDLSKIGIEATLDVVSPPKWMETGMSGGWNSGLFYVTLAATDFNYCAFLERYFLPTSLFSTPVLGYPEGWFEKMDAMLKSSDPDVYIPLAKELVKDFEDYAVAIPLWAVNEVYVLDPSVHEMGVGTHGDGFTWNANKVWISQD